MSMVVTAPVVGHPQHGEVLVGDIGCDRCEGVRFSWRSAQLELHECDA